jgi:hypothetical protein
LDILFEWAPSEKKGSEVKGLRKQFFSEEKNQKTFVCWRLRHVAFAGQQVAMGAGEKVFWFFSSEKNCFDLTF